ncbi:hypothetical protein RRG08_025449 [Elysia crispata]|uniref:Uncharacterized protein n=1 Tax=Elysia crispata TaxID=231223 RepID=A0AAE1CWD6_9GAST|nr:hypothetical protein RRG08_025449 [Elysia crispata]
MEITVTVTGPVTRQCRRGRCVMDGRWTSLLYLMRWCRSSVTIGFGTGVSLAGTLRGVINTTLCDQRQGLVTWLDNSSGHHVASWSVRPESCTEVNFWSRTSAGLDMKALNRSG